LRRPLAQYDGDNVSHISNEEVLLTPADILVPAALGGVLTPEVAWNVQAKAVIEAANAPTDPEADEILNKRGIPVIPDILANAGGVTVSYFEWAQNIQCLRWTEEEVNHRLKHIMASSHGAEVEEATKSLVAHCRIHRRAWTRREGHRAPWNLSDCQP
jgi:glutamate dehydrogenase (NAD(P)+)